MMTALFFAELAGAGDDTRAGRGEGTAGAGTRGGAGLALAPRKSAADTAPVSRLIGFLSDSEAFWM